MDLTSYFLEYLSNHGTVSITQKPDWSGEWRDPFVEFTSHDYGSFTARGETITDQLRAIYESFRRSSTKPRKKKIEVDSFTHTV